MLIQLKTQAVIEYPQVQLNNGHNLLISNNQPLQANETLQAEEGNDVYSASLIPN